MTRNITIDHIVFYLEQEAFEVLENYLEYLSLTNSNNNRRLKEEQMAEYFLSKLGSNNQVNTLRQVQYITKKLEAVTRSLITANRLLPAKLLVGQYLWQLEWGVN